MLEIQHARASDLAHIRDLFLEYADSLGISLDFQNFEAELAGLPGEYQPPSGCLLVAKLEGNLAGCVAMRKIDAQTCEMKRLYVRPQFQGLKIGKKLAESVIEAARKLGYSRMRLDTLPSMKSARSLYASLGFKEIPPYRHNPIEGTSFMELEFERKPPDGSIYDSTNRRFVERPRRVVDQDAMTPRGRANQKTNLTTKDQRKI